VTGAGCRRRAVLLLMFVLDAAQAGNSMFTSERTRENAPGLVPAGVM
jgi:hypothetical protein